MYTTAKRRPHARLDTTAVPACQAARVQPALPPGCSRMPPQTLKCASPAPLVAEPAQKASQQRQHPGTHRLRTRGRTRASQCAHGCFCCCRCVTGTNPIPDAPFPSTAETREAPGPPSMGAQQTAGANPRSLTTTGTAHARRHRRARRLCAPWSLATDCWRTVQSHTTVPHPCATHSTTLSVGLKRLEENQTQRTSSWLHAHTLAGSSACSAAVPRIGNKTPDICTHVRSSRAAAGQDRGPD